MLDQNYEVALDEAATQGEEAVPAGSAILRAIRIMEAIAQYDSPPQLAELCRAIDLPKPTVYRILATLEHAGWVGREPGSKRYACAQKFNNVAGEVLLRSPQRAARHALLEELVEQVGETCNLTIPNVNSVLYLDRVEASWPLRVSLGAGSKVPLYASASGKLFLSYMARRSRDRFLRLTPLIKHTTNTLSDPGKLSRELDEIRQRGYSCDNEEYLPGISCLAVPVRDSDSRVVAAVAVHAPTSRMTVEQALEFLPTLREAAESISQTIDW
jgi:IclR family transcriptional regulator, acetate operon repressor